VLDFIYAPPAAGPLTVTPSLTITEEFNDNVFQNNMNKHSDFITQFTPGLTLQMQHPGFQLLAGYNFTAEIYAKETELDNAANRQNFFANLSYQLTPNVTLALTEGFHADRNTNLTSISAVSSGRQQSFSNVFAPSMSVQLTQRTSWRLSGAYTLQRFSGQGSQDSDIYRIGTGVSYALTPRLTVTADYDFGYLDIQQEPTTLTHTPRVGGTYQITRTLSASLSGGPSVVVTDRDTTLSPSVSARVVKQMSWGSMGAFYDRAVGTTGAFGGPSDNQTFGGNITVLTLVRGLFVDFSPRYSISKTESVARTSSDINALTLSVVARYQITRYIGLVGSYTFLHQRGSGSSSVTSSGNTNTATTDVDQNRVNFGVQFGYPINFD
jgi:hypothetical protein